MSSILLAVAMKKIPLGTSYAVWTGIGIVGTSVMGFLVYKENFSILHAICILLILLGVAGLKLLEK